MRQAVIPEDHWPYVLDWSQSNLDTLFQVGFESGLEFYENNTQALAA